MPGPCVGQREPCMPSRGEFGVRMALGSKPTALAAMVLKQSAWWMAAGLAGGGFGIRLVIWFAPRPRYGVRPFDPLPIGAVVAILTVSAALALLILSAAIL